MGGKKSRTMMMTAKGAYLLSLLLVQLGRVGAGPLHVPGGGGPQGAGQHLPIEVSGADVGRGDGCCGGGEGDGRADVLGGGHREGACQGARGAVGAERGQCRRCGWPLGAAQGGAVHC